jgi:hypothetical protein
MESIPSAQSAFPLALPRTHYGRTRTILGRCRLAALCIATILRQIVEEMMADEDWLQAEDVGEEDAAIGEFDLSATPNDFNVKTIIDFLGSNVIVIPTFQRNYVWDIKRASKLIESLILGLPVPQIFLYEESRNKFLVIDGQQRLMSLHYFVQKRFPKVDKRGQLRLMADGGVLPKEILGDDEYFTNFRLQLPSPLPNQENKLNKLNYDTLDELRTSLDLRTIRCVIIKQNAPPEDNSSVYEIFNRLNTGGVNLTPQEIRTSLYHSVFYELLYEMNANPIWRRTIGLEYPDLRLRDVELLLRGAAMLIKGQDYKPSLTRFLNQFSKDMRSASKEQLTRLKHVYLSFFGAASDLPAGIFGTGSRLITVSVFESVFAACCERAFAEGREAVPKLDASKIEALKSDEEFGNASSYRTADSASVQTRLRKAKEILA